MSSRVNRPASWRDGDGLFDRYTLACFEQKKSPASSFEDAGQIPGDDLLSQDLSSHYHWRCGVSLPGSERDRVVPPRSGHQRAMLTSRASFRIVAIGFNTGSLGAWAILLIVY